MEARIKDAQWSNSVNAQCGRMRILTRNCQKDPQAEKPKLQGDEDQASLKVAGIQNLRCRASSKAGAEKSPRHLTCQSRGKCVESFLPPLSAPPFTCDSCAEREESLTYCDAVFMKAGSEMSSAHNCKIFKRVDLNGFDCTLF